MKNLIIVAMLMIGTSAMADKTKTNIVLIGAGFDSQSFTGKTKELPDSMAITYLTEDVNSVLLGITMTNRGGFLTNIGFKF